MRFDGKVALVTGASSGMGAETARLLAEDGARVFTAQRRAAGFEDITADLSDRYVEASFVTGQVWTIDGGRMTKLSLP